MKLLTMFLALTFLTAIQDFIPKKEEFLEKSEGKLICYLNINKVF